MIPCHEKNYINLFYNLLDLQVKIQGRDEEMLQKACQQFLGHSEDDIRNIATETIEGHQRAIIGDMTVEVQQMSYGKYFEGQIRLEFEL